jgi:hypothetical protein
MDDLFAQGSLVGAGWKRWLQVIDLYGLDGLQLQMLPPRLPPRQFSACLSRCSYKPPPQQHRVRACRTRPLPTPMPGSTTDRPAPIATTPLDAGPRASRPRNCRASRLAHFWSRLAPRSAPPATLRPARHGHEPPGRPATSPSVPGSAQGAPFARRPNAGRRRKATDSPATPDRRAGGLLHVSQSSALADRSPGLLERRLPEDSGQNF